MGFFFLFSAMRARLSEEEQKRRASFFILAYGPANAKMGSGSTCKVLLKLPCYSHELHYTVRQLPLTLLKKRCDILTQCVNVSNRYICLRGQSSPCSKQPFFIRVFGSRERCMCKLQLSCTMFSFTRSAALLLRAGQKKNLRRRVKIKGSSEF